MGMNLGRDAPLFSNPFVEPKVREKMTSRMKEGTGKAMEPVQRLSKSRVCDLCWRLFRTNVSHFAPHLPNDSQLTCHERNLSRRASNSLACNSSPDSSPSRRTGRSTGTGCLPLEYRSRQCSGYVRSIDPMRCIDHYCIALLRLCERLMCRELVCQHRCIRLGGITTFAFAIQDAV